MQEDREKFIDGVYEAAIIPEYWAKILLGVAALGDADNASLLACDRSSHLKYAGTPDYIGQLKTFASVAHKYQNSRTLQPMELGLNGFATTLGVGRETVRTRLKSILSKTGPERQADFRLLLDGTRSLHRYDQEN